MLTAYLSNTYNYTLHVLEGKSVGKAFCGIAKEKQQIEELFICCSRGLTNLHWQKFKILRKKMFIIITQLQKSNEMKSCIN